MFIFHVALIKAELCSQCSGALELRVSTDSFRIKWSSEVLSQALFDTFYWFNMFITSHRRKGCSVASIYEKKSKTSKMELPGFLRTAAISLLSSRNHVSKRVSHKSGEKSISLLSRGYLLTPFLRFLISIENS